MIIGGSPRLRTTRRRLARTPAEVDDAPMQAAEPVTPPFRLRSLWLSAYIPTLLFAVGQGAIIAGVPLFAAHQLGATLAAAGFMGFLRNFGTALFDVPAGSIVDRFGERRAMVYGTIALIFVGVGCALSRAPWQLMVFNLLMGEAWAIFLLARLSYITDLTPPNQRGKALSILGGVNRMGNLIGPVIGGYAAQAFGLGAPFYLQALMAGLAAAVLFFVVDETNTRSAAGGAHGSLYRRVGTVVVEHRRIFATAGVVTVAIQLLRNGRQILLPLWAVAIGLDAKDTGLVVGLSSVLDVVMFYPVGIVTDRWGRKWVAIPCLLILAFGIALTPLAHTASALVIVGIIGGFGNGLGSGIVMTLGADFSPIAQRGEFLGVWRLIGDIGGLLGPGAISAITGAFTLGDSAVAISIFGLLGAGLMAFGVPEPLHHGARLRAAEAARAAGDPPPPH